MQSTSTDRVSFGAFIAALVNAAKPTAQTAQLRIPFLPTGFTAPTTGVSIPTALSRLPMGEGEREQFREDVSERGLGERLRLFVPLLDCVLSKISFEALRGSPSFSGRPRSECKELSNPSSSSCVSSNICSRSNWIGRMPPSSLLQCSTPAMACQVIRKSLRSVFAVFK